MHPQRDCSVSVRKFGTVVMYMADDKEAVPSRGTLLRKQAPCAAQQTAPSGSQTNFRHWRRECSPYWKIPTRKLCRSSMPAPLRVITKKLSVTIGQHYSDVEKGKIVTVIDGKCPVASLIRRKSIPSKQQCNLHSHWWHERLRHGDRQMALFKGRQTRGYHRA